MSFMSRDVKEINWSSFEHKIQMSFKRQDNVTNTLFSEKLFLTDLLTGFIDGGLLSFERSLVLDEL